jgi:uncharacterized membrane protein (UPF0127 family)
MNPTRWIFDDFVQRHSATADVRLRISNLTRQSELAHHVEVADYGAKRRKGLLGREMLSRGEGLWIVPCEAVHTFGMKFPIDLVYLDRDKRVKKIRNNMPPWRISVCLSAHSVLELSSGSIRRTGTKPGDRLEFTSAFQLNDCRISPDASVPTLPKPGNKRGIALLTQQRKLRAIAEFLVVGICTVAFTLTAVGISGVLLTGNSVCDFVSYWAAGQQLVHRANPYDADAILRLERSAGFPDGLPALVMRNPPSALLLALPLGFFSPRTGALLWSLLLIACLTISVRLLWIMHGRPKDHLHLVAYSFAPALACLLAGQTGLFVLLGLALFLRLHRTRPFLAGVSLWLCALKPHLFLPFCLALLVWIVVTKSYSVLIGASLSLIISTAVAFILGPLAWIQYGQMMRASGISGEAIPCLSIMFHRISPNTAWGQYLPMFLGCVWALAYFRKHYNDWDWMGHGSLVMLVSLVVAPYAWFTDQAILIPALLHAVYLARSRRLVAIPALASAVIEIGIFRGIPLLHSALYLWTAPAWLAWYLYATKRSYATNVYQPPLLADGALIGTIKD